MNIQVKPKKVIIDRAKMLVCEKCAELGTPILEPKLTFFQGSNKLTKKVDKVSTITTIKKKESIQEELELRKNFGSVIRKAREKQGLNHEDLGLKIGEKQTLLKKVEKEKIIPNEKLAMKLEHFLKIKILVKTENSEVLKKVSSTRSSKLTLGEIANIKISKNRNK